MNSGFLEQYYEKVILPLYVETITFSSIRWKDHGKVGADAWAHYFEDENGREYVLLCEDFPGSDYLNDDLTHDAVPVGEQMSVHVSLSPEKTVENIFGYFTLYKERR